MRPDWSVCTENWVTAVSAQSPTGSILTLVNQLRASYGLPGFTYDPQLAAAAQAHANWMAQTAVYSHTGAGGSTPQTRANAEASHFDGRTDGKDQQVPD